MPSTLELVCAEFRAVAADAAAEATSAVALAEQVEGIGRRVGGLMRGSSRQGPMVARYEAAAQKLRQAAAALSQMGRLADEFAHELCGGTAVSEGAGAPARGRPVTVDPVGGPHGGHGGGPGRQVPAARVPVEDITRDRVTWLITEGGVDRPENLPAAVVAFRQHWIEQGGHAGLRHDATQVDDQALRDRCTRGHDPITGSRVDWEHGGDHGYGRDATAFTTPEALVFAEARVWSCGEALAERDRADNEGALFHRVAVDASSVFGHDFRDYCRGFERLGSKQNPTGWAPIGFPSGTQLFAVYKRQSIGSPWYLYTIYPRRQSP